MTVISHAVRKALPDRTFLLCCRTSSCHGADNRPNAMNAASTIAAESSCSIHGPRHFVQISTTPHPFDVRLYRAGMLAGPE